MLTRYGSISTPSLAIPAVTIAICSGLAATSYCPIALRASCAWFISSGNWLATPPTSARWRRSKPNACAWARSLSSPTSRPSFANAVLHETFSAWVMVTRVPPQLVELGRKVLVPGSRSRFGASTTDSGFLPSASAAAAVTSLKVDPGRIDLPGRAVGQRPVGVGGQPVVGLVGGVDVVAGDLVRVVARAGDHGEDGSGGRVEREYRALLVAQSLRPPPPGSWARWWSARWRPQASCWSPGRPGAARTAHRRYRPTGSCNCSPGRSGHGRRSRSR